MPITYGGPEIIRDSVRVDFIRWGEVSAGTSRCVAIVGVHCNWVAYRDLELLK